MGELFSKYFLEEGIKTTEDYKLLDEDSLYDKYVKIKKIYDSFPKNLKKDETFTEDNLIKPILDILGFYYTRQTSIDKKGRMDVLDYLLFQSIEDKVIFDNSEISDRPYHKIISILEAKRWDRELDKGDKSDQIDPSIPSNQILRYLSSIDTSSNGNVLWGILTNGKIFRLYYHKFPSRSEGFVEFDLDDIFKHNGELFQKENLEKFKIFYIIFRKEAFIKTPLRPNKTFLEIALEEGKKWEERISSDLKDKIFSDVFPELAKGFIKNLNQNFNENVLKDIYDNILILLYRLLFLFYAEDRALLPVYDKNYYEYSMTKIREEIMNKIDKDEKFSENASTYYNKLSELFKILNLGDKSLKISPYNGKLFDNNYHQFLMKYTVPDSFLVPAIDKLSREYKDNTKKRINYRDLSVRQLGTIYEGLLEFKLKVAEDNLKIKKEKGREIYEIAKEKDKIDIKKGEVYITNDKSERKVTGSYYTPDYIVQYIVKNCLNPLIEEKIDNFKNQIERIKKLSKNELQKELNLFNSNSNINSLRNKLLKKYDIIDSILNINIVDPAMGSGHFLVGAVDYLSDKILEIIDEYSNKEIFGKERYINPILEKIEEIRNKIIKKSKDEGYLIEESYLNDKNIIKRVILKRCIYGVDLNPLAVELAKVSLWLHTFTVGAPLSFLDHHLKCGNSLIGSCLEEFYQKVLKKELWLFGSPFTGFLRAIDELKRLEKINDLDISEVEESSNIYDDVIKTVKPYKKLLDLYNLTFFYDSKDNPIVKLIDGSRGDPLDVLLENLNLTSDEKKIIEDSLNYAKEKKFFHWKLEFPEIFYEEGKEKENGGFDIVIGNPPYIRQEKLKDIKEVFQKLEYEVYNSSSDIYTYFYEKGYDLLRKGGVLGFITSNKWMRAKYGEKLRKLFLEKTNLKNMIDFSGLNVFESATVDTNVTIFEKRESDFENDVLVSNIKEDFNGNLENYVKEYGFYLKQKEFNLNSFTIEKGSILDLKKKIEKVGIPLKDWDVNIYYGIKTGFNEAFIVNEDKRDEILKNCKDEDERERTEKIIKPILRGRDIFRYGYRWAGLWIILMKFGIYKEIPIKYPTIYNYLNKYQKQLKERGQCKYNRESKININKDYPGQHHWLELDNNPTDEYLKEFEKEKIVWQEIVQEPSFAYENKNFYCEATTFIMTGDNIKYLLGILNSKPVSFFFRKFYAGGGLGGEGYRYKKAFLEQLPIPKPSDEIQTKITELVDNMIDYTYKKQILKLFLQNKIKSGTTEMIEVFKELQTHTSWSDNPSFDLKKEIAKNLINTYEEKISKTDKLIDSIIYKLYNLTNEEIKLLETHLGGKND